MKRKIVATALVLAGLSTLAVGVATGGTASDPLVSLSHLEETYTPDVLTQAQTAMDTAFGGTYDQSKNELDTLATYHLLEAGVLSGDVTYHAVFQDVRLKEGDVIQVTSGSGFTLLAGKASLAYTGSGVADISLGAPAGPGTLSEGHRYLAGEGSVATLTVDSATAVISLEGMYTVTDSDSLDYTALAETLVELGLLKGSDSAYGSGYDLEEEPTRIQGLILFLRLIGEEEEALTRTGTCPFVDVPTWCAPYVTYAYEMGYTKGVDAQAMLFDTQRIVTAEEYMMFVMRALGYTEGTDFAWGTTLDSALGAQLITQAEHTLFVEADFLRAQVSYLSYFALDMARADGTTLLSYLEGNDTLDGATVAEIRENCPVERLK